MPLDPRTWQPPAFHAGRPGLVRPVPVDDSGLRGPTRGQLTGRGWRRAGRGLYLPARFTDEPVEQRILEASLRLPAEHSAVTGWAALRWAGARYFDGTTGRGGRRPVPLLVANHTVRRPAGATLTAERLAGDDYLDCDGLRITNHLRSVTFEMRHARNLRAAVRALDLAAAHDLVSIDEVAAYTRQHLTGWTGVGQCRHALALADENAWSPPEIDMRLLWVVELGLRPLCNRPVFDDGGRHVGTPDLIDVEAGLVGEYDGAHHLAGEQRGRDLRREGAFRRVGLEYVAMVAADWSDPSDYLSRVMGARRRALASRSVERRWTVRHPPWWTPTETVEQRRALDGWQRSRLLGLRAG